MAMRLVLIMTTTTENLELDSMFDPPHPGEILREDVFPEMGLTVTEAASQIGVMISDIAGEKCPSPF